MKHIDELIVYNYQFGFYPNTKNNFNYVVIGHWPLERWLQQLRPASYVWYN